MEKVSNVHNRENSLLNNVISTFLEIEDKIVALNQCSSQDFSALDNKLEENTLLSEKISGKINEILNLLDNDGNIDCLENMLFEVYSSISDLKDLEKAVDSSIKLLNSLMNELSHVQLPLNNFNQNLSSLKVLLVNVKLISTCGKKSLYSFDVEESEKIEVVIDKVKNVCPVISENIIVLKNHLKKLHDDLIHLKDNELNELKTNIELVRHNLYSAVEQIRGIINNRHNIESRAENLYDSINSIIPILQCKDSIRNKVGYFYNTHDTVLNTLRKINNNGDDNGNGHNGKMEELKIPQVSDNQVFRLLQINKEYQHSVERITTQMTYSKDDIDRVISQLNIFAKKSHLNSNMIGNFEAFSELFSNVLAKYQEHIEELSLVDKVFNQLTQKFYDMEMMERAVEQRIIDKIHIGELLIRYDENISQSAQKIFKIYSDNHYEKAKLAQIFEKNNNTISSLSKMNTVYSFKNGSLHKLGVTLDDLNRNYKKVSCNNTLVDKKQKEISELGDRIIENIDKAFEYTNYYKLFEKTSREVVYMLKQVNKKMRYFNIDSKSKVRKVT